MNIEYVKGKSWLKGHKKVGPKYGSNYYIKEKEPLSIWFNSEGDGIFVCEFDDHVGYRKENAQHAKQYCDLLNVILADDTLIALVDRALAHEAADE